MTNFTFYFKKHKLKALFGLAFRLPFIAVSLAALRSPSLQHEVLGIVCSHVNEFTGFSDHGFDNLPGCLLIVLCE
ncbi:hypothetical protein NL676_019700 [Syzygium grande]|nr:hypothetical protein NL676_019700 [Syzygium grande]